MLFLHARVHQVRLRDLVAGQLAAVDASLRPLIAVCPSCGETYFADLSTDSTHDGRELEAWEALAKLDGECHDHPHWFTVGPYQTKAMPL